MLWGVAALTLAACSTWQPFAAALERPEPTRLPYALRITRTDGSRVTLLAPFVRGDTLYGRIGRDTLLIPLQQVRQLERQQFRVGRTIALVLAVPVGFVLVYLIRCGDSGCGPTPVS